MKDKYNKVIATGLISLMLASVSACDSALKPNDDHHGGVTNKPQWETSINNNQSNTEHDKQGLTGDVWKLMQKNGIIDYSNFDNRTYGQMKNVALPIKFLQQEGLLYKDGDQLIVNGKQPSSDYRPFWSNVFINRESAENDVYVLVEYSSDKARGDNPNPNVWLATYMLKYNLDDDDYETLLKLEGDYRARFFIQAMDEIYQPQVISKGVITHNIVMNNSPFEKDEWVDREFPRIYCAGVDYNNQIITLGARCKEGYALYDVDIRKSSTWEAVGKFYNCTEEELEELVEFDSIDTIVGRCLNTFALGPSEVVRMGLDKVKDLYENSDNIIEMELYDAYSDNYNSDYENSK